MESSIVSVLDSLINTDGVKGVLVTDKHGLCLGVRGIANSVCSGFISSIAKYAKNFITKI
nr:101_t:CDS:2 [Entrophospora candida]